MQTPASPALLAPIQVLPTHFVQPLFLLLFQELLDLFLAGLKADLTQILVRGVNPGTGLDCRGGLNHSYLVV